MKNYTNKYTSRQTQAQVTAEAFEISIRQQPRQLIAVGDTVSILGDRHQFEVTELRPDGNISGEGPNGMCFHGYHPETLLVVKKGKPKPAATIQ